MNSLKHFPLGAPFPESPHAVASSLPTMAAVRGYEEKDPEVMQAVQTGYPRFVAHVYVRKLIAYYVEREALTGRGAVLIPSRRAANYLIDSVGGELAIWPVEEDLYLVHYNAVDEVQAKSVGKYQQHVGCGISSRQAEDLLRQHGLLDALFEEEGFFGHALSKVEQDLAQLTASRPQDVLVCSSGMNAFFAGFRAIQEFQATRKRGRWLQLGWLYLDSGCILKNFLGENETLEYCYDVLDTDALIAKIQEAGKELAGVVVECPTNPLVQICDLERVSGAVREAGGVLLVDPTIGSVYNMDVLRHCDVLVTSLTKYACFEGDVMIGALVMNPESPYYGDLVLRTSRYYVPPYRRDLERLARQMERAPEIVTLLNANAARLAKYLKGHSAVKRVFFSLDSEHFDSLAQSKGSGGAVVSIELAGSIDAFYDSIKLMKGPSFGTQFSLLSPFMYLAHYDLVTSLEGREFLAGVGIDPELIRISVGGEPYEAIEAIFDRALESSIVS